VPREVGRYVLHDEIASGGMATVYVARQRGEVGFSRVVAVKMLHAHYAREDSFRAMFLDEARLVSRIRHPNVVATLDVVQDGGELVLVMEYVHGETLSRLVRQAAAHNEPVPLGVAAAIVGDVLEGLHAAHEATAESGEPLHIVHRDVSPQNVLVASDGVAHVADFGVAKAAGRLAAKYSNQGAKGKAGYMAPEQMRGGGDRRADVYAAGVVLWEVLVGRRLFDGESFFEIVTKAMDAPVPAPSTLRADVGPELDLVVKRALAHDPKKRFATAREMALALEAAATRASAREVGEWVVRIASDTLAARRTMIERAEGTCDASAPEVEEAAPQIARAPSRSRGYFWLAGSVLSIGAVVAAIFVTRRPSPAVPVAATPTPSSTPSAPAPVRAADLVPSAPASTAAVPASAASAPKPTTRPTAHAASPRAPRAPAAAPSSCHWVELPDEHGILIPKKVCP
jgi:serine/threonine-protein kinase